MNRTRLAATAALVVAGSMTTGPLEPAGANPVVPSATSGTSAQDIVWAQSNAQTDLAEISIGQLAERRAMLPATKQLAATTTSDHQTALANLQHVAAQVGISLPTSPSTPQLAAAQHLMNVPADQFDRAYDTIQIAGHEQSISQTSFEIGHGSNPLVTGYAAQYLPVAEGHLSMAQSDYRAMGGPALQTSCVTSLPSGRVTGAAALPDGTGYVETDAVGDVAVFGAVGCYGSLTGTHLNSPIVGVAVDGATGGYWLVGADGGVFSFNAPFEGSAAKLSLRKPIVGIAPGPNDQGYWLVASDGGIFAYNEPFAGSAAHVNLNQPVIGMAADPATGGYWLVASDGGVFSYNAPFHGSAGALKLQKPIVGVAANNSGTGYDLFASDGGVFTYNMPFFGSLGGMRLNRPVIGGAIYGGSPPGGTLSTSPGYWMISSDGGVFTFGGAPFLGSAAG